MADNDDIFDAIRDRPAEVFECRPLTREDLENAYREATGEDPPRSVHAKIAESHPSLTRGQVWCRTCGHTEKVNSEEALRFGWPKCCGFTMTIDSPEEQAKLCTESKS